MRKLVLFLLCSVSLALAAEESFKVYNRANGGFVIMEGDEIVGYSNHGSFDQIPDNAKGFLRSVGIKDSLFQVSGFRFQDGKIAPERVEKMLAAMADVEVGPILGDIAYDQGAPYNNETPVYKGHHCPTGCVATAMVQIMDFYKHPKVCHGSVSYKTATLNITISKNLEGYEPDWANILPAYQGDYTEAQGKAIADLMFAAGASVEMDYNEGGSGTQSMKVAPAMAGHFDYDEAAEFVSKSDYVDADWHNLLQSEINAGRPLYYSSTQQQGDGHAYVCDGYQIQEGYEKYPFYHFNWGWGGLANGWFRLNKLHAKITMDGDELDISYNQHTIIHLAPKGTLPIENVDNVTGVDGDAPMYDIYGRVVTEPQAGHLYIQNGYKIFVR